MSDESRVNLYLRAENRLVFGAKRNRPLPVTIVTGFLGAGKTTLMRHILANKHNLRVAAAVNDFAELNIDGDLVANLPSSTTGKAAERVVELSNGCVCCSLSKDLESAVWSMLDNDVDVGRIEYLVIETSGVTDPHSIIRSLDATFGKMYRARLDCVVTVVDAEQWEVWIPKTGEAKVPEGVVRSQLACADVVLLNKKELVEEEALKRISEYIAKASPGVAIYPTQYSRVGLSRIMDVTIHDHSGKNASASVVTHEESEEAYFVNGTDDLAYGRPMRKRDHRSGEKSHSHDSKVHAPEDAYTTVCFEWSETPMSLEKLSEFCLKHLPRQTVRMKGVCWVAEHGLKRCILHMSGRARLHFRSEQPFQGPPHTRIVFIGPDLEEKTLLSHLQAVCLPKQRQERKLDPSTWQKAAYPMLRRNDLFDVVDTSDWVAKDAGTTSVIGVRFNGAKRLKAATETDVIRRASGVNIDRLNLHILDSFNSKGKGLLTYAHRHTDSRIVILLVQSLFSPSIAETNTSRDDTNKEHEENNAKFSETPWGLLQGITEDIFRVEIASRITECKCE
mmetsp:Transcript_4356/g.10201  ORF Transcript_4356/g.10201 Transcript_4356/m.10201 type:complete len:562 (-) Transcript_4356:90-1775(-)